MKQCQKCKHNNTEKYGCAKTNEMTLDEYEDYYIDMVKRCPYYERRTDEKKLQRQL